MELLDISNASLYVKGNNIFSDVNITIEKGECHAIVGLDNQGKSSLLYAILGYNHFSSGSMTLSDTLDCSIKEYLLYKTRFVPDKMLNFSKMTGLDFLKMTSKLCHKNNNTDTINDLTTYFDIDTSIPLNHLSDNDNKCLYIISALISEPEFLILDEPFNYLNDKSSDLLKKWIKSYTSSGNTVLITSDNFNDIKYISDTITVMSDRTVSNKSLPVTALKEYMLIVAYEIDTHSIPDNVKVVEQNLYSCSLFFSGTKEELLTVLNTLICSKFTVNIITDDDILHNKYPWLEDVL